MPILLTILVLLFGLLALAVWYANSQAALVQAQAELEKWRGIHEFASATHTATTTNQIAVMGLLLVLIVILGVICATLYLQLRKLQAVRPLRPAQPAAVQELPAQPVQPALPAGDPMAMLIQLQVLEALERRNRPALPPSEWRQS